jgi:hypothetical protein
MATFGDALRGYASVLNPQVANEVAQEDRQQQAQNQQLGMLLLQKKMQEQSPQYQAQLEALNNEKQFRIAAAQAQGDPTKIAAAAAQFGKPELAVSLYNQQEARAARLQQAKDTLQARQDALQLQIEQKNLDRDQRERANEMMAELKRQGLALQGEIAKGNQQLKAMQFQMQGDQQTVKQTQQLGMALEKANLPEADAVLGAVEDSLKKNPDLASYLSGPKSMLPDMVVGTDIAAGRQAFQKLFNITLKNRSGAAVTNQEMDRLKSEFAAGAFKTPAQLQKAVDQARSIINKHYASVASGYGPKALDAYNENMRGLGGRVVLESQQQTETPSKVVDFSDLK